MINIITQKNCINKVALISSSSSNLFMYECNTIYLVSTFVHDYDFKLWACISNVVMNELVVNTIS